MKPTRSMTMAFLALLLSMTTPAGAGQQTVQAVMQSAADRQPAPAFRLRDASGKIVELSEFHGKPVVLNVWATECAGCKAELPTFADLHRSYKDHGLTVIGVSMDVMYEDLKTTAEGWARVKPFANAHDLRYVIVMDDGSVEKAYSVTAMPATYLIDKRGRIAATYIGIVDASDLRANVKTLLAEHE